MEEEFELPKNAKKTIKRLWQSVNDQYLTIVIVVISVIFYVMLSVVAPLYSAKVIDLIWNNVKSAMYMNTIFSITWQNCGKEIFILLMIYVGIGVFYLIQNFLMASFPEKLNLRLRTEVSKKMNKLPLSYFDKYQPGDILSKMTNDMDKMSEAIQSGLLKLFVAIGTIIGSFIMMFRINIYLTIIFLIFIGISFYITNVISNKTLKYAKQRQEAIGDLTIEVEEAYSGRTIIKSFNQEEKSLNEMYEKINNVAKTTQKADFVMNSINPLIRLLNRIGQVAIAILAGKMLIEGNLTIGIFQAFFQYMGQVTEPLTEASYMIISMQSAIASAERIYELLDEEEIIEDEKTANVIKNAKGNVSFKNIKFGYSKDKLLIKDISFDVKQGQKIAIVGATGAGKTTLINLLMRFYELNGGKILLDGIDIKEITRENLRNCFGMVLQDTWLFEGTIAENIAYGKPNATQEEIEEVAKKARVDFFIRTMPKGYNTILNNDAENISVGQKQLLTIARAMLCNPSVLILDEATSSVDTRTEKEIGKAMDNLMKNRTSFVIAHRLSTIMDADMILVMKDGNIVEKGNHEELIEQNGVYAELYNSQFA
ncbi:MAG TPA: ABC transporter ATP-binding protein/permease [Clostridiaceae bacterium]|nr:ABC transporter ATP-binding protein/permease [Clostridiaceae bacterium]